MNLQKSLNDKMGFGKYKLHTVKEVLEDDPTYIEWSLDNIEWFDLDDTAMEKYEKTIECHYMEKGDNWGHDPYFD